MAITINAKGTSVPFFTIGKNGTTIYQGSVDPSLTYTPKNGDIWFNSNTNVISSWITPTTSWSAPQLADIKFSGSSILAATSTALSLVTDPGQSVVLDAGTGPAKLTTTIGNDLYISDSLGGSLYLNNLQWPSTDGSANQVLTTNGTGGLSWATASVGTVTSVGLADFSIAPIYSITNTPITSSGDISMALVAQSANTAFLAPNGSLGQPSFRNIAYADLPLTLYKEHPLSPAVSITSGTNSVAIGDGANAYLYGSKAFANGNFSNTGDAQHGVYVLRNITTDDTPTVLFLDGISAPLVTPNNSVVTFSIIIAAKRTDTTGGAAGYKFDGVVMKDATSSSMSFVGSPSKTILGETNSIWDISITASTTNGSLQVTVKGEANKTIQWVATVMTTEVTI